MGFLANPKKLLTYMVNTLILSGSTHYFAFCAPISIRSPLQYFNSKNFFCYSLWFLHWCLADCSPPLDRVSVPPVPSNLPVMLNAYASEPITPNHTCCTDAQCGLTSLAAVFGTARDDYFSCSGNNA